MEIVFTEKIRHKLYRVFIGMHERCEYPKHKSYDYYGGRGIGVSSEWDEFEPFYEWAKKSGYQPGLTIERENNHLGYSPDNCRWATRNEQMLNTRATIALTVGGETKSSAAWGEDERAKVSAATIRRRIRKGVGAEEAIATPDQTRRYVTAFGETKSTAEWVDDPRCVVCYSALSFRLQSGWEPERALTQPSGNYTKGGTEAVAFGESKTLAKWAKDPRCVVKKSTLFRRILHYGVDPEAAITTPARKRTAKAGVCVA